MILSWRLGPRLGVFRPTPGVEAPSPNNWALVALGVMLILVAITLFAMGAGFVTPDLGFIGISMTTSGFGRTYTNIYMSFAGGAFVGAILAYRTKLAFFALLGPLAGYVSCSALFDIATPWETALVSLGGPIAAYLVYKALRARGIDDLKIAPLTLGPGIYGALMAGIVGWGDGTGGYIGITEGPFAFQHAEINLWWQFVGVVVIVVGGGLVALLVVTTIERTLGLRVTEREEIQGLDETYWPGSVPAPAPVARAGEAALGGSVQPAAPVVTSPER